MSSKNASAVLIINMLGDKPLVSVCTLAYNQAPYIRECLDGILMQKTTFVFELLIHDDASTDGTADIIREYEAKYPDIIKPIYQTENQYSKRVSISQKYQYPRVKGKYIAICEGDDYWTDPLKLQKQVDFLENNSEYALCFTRAQILMCDKTLENGWNYLPNFEPTVNDLIIANYIPTLTTMIRAEYLYKYYDEVNPATQKWMMGDYPLWIWISLSSKIKYLTDITAVYRHVDGSVSHSKDTRGQLLFQLNTIDIRRYFKDRYNISEDSYLRGVRLTYKKNRALAMDIGMWNVIREEIHLMRNLRKWDRYIKLKLLYINRNNKKILSFLRKHIK